MAYTWAPVPIETCGLMRLHRAHRHPETRDAGWVWYACRLLAHEFQADGRLEYDGLPLEAADLAHRIGTDPEMVEACLALFLAWGREGGWLRKDADGCYVVADAEPLSADEKDARRKAQANARQARRRARLAGAVTPAVTPTVTESVTPVTPTVTNVTQDVTLASRSASRSLARAIASETETETKTSENQTTTRAHASKPPDPPDEPDPLEVPVQRMVDAYNACVETYKTGEPVVTVMGVDYELRGRWWDARKLCDAQGGEPLNRWNEYLARLFGNDLLAGKKPGRDGRLFTLTIGYAARPDVWARAWNGGYAQRKPAATGASNGGIGAWSQKRKAAELAAGGVG